tara:strand:+ start:4570 stop:5592 length:1023 start_codon:yes stop_codon:yes gene_type:complete
MEDEINTAVAEAEPESVDNQNISASDFVQRRSEALLGQQSEEKSQESAEEASEEEVPEQATEGNVLSQFDLDSLSDEEKDALRQQLIPGAQSRISELTARRKAAEEELQTMQLTIKQPQVKDNPLSNLSTIEDLQKKSDEVNDVISWAEDLLFESDEYSADEEITTVEGRPMTKAEVRKALQSARKSRDSYIPDQLKKLQGLENAKTMRQQLGSKAVEELEWLRDENENELKSQFISIMSDPRLKDLESSSPDLYSQIPYFMSHAVNSIYGRKPVNGKGTPVSKKSLKLTPSSGSTPASAMSEKTERPLGKALKEHKTRFKSSGRKDDFITLRTLQLQSK